MNITREESDDPGRVGEPARIGLAYQRWHRARDPRSGYKQANEIRRLVREALIAGGLGQTNPDVPMADIVPEGSSVLLKPNWVYHRNRSRGPMECLVTHPVFLEAALLEVAAANPAKVIIGDAPLQGCDFEELMSFGDIRAMAERAPCPVEIRDFRRTKFKEEEIEDGIVQDAREKDRYSLFDLAGDSLLEPVSDPPGRFRVTMYDPRELAKTHCAGRHQYLLCREAFDADVVFNLPKLKTHMKAGLTGALKNLVGLNGNKDYLPHHRVGGSGWGGDCYQGRAPFKRCAEYFLDHANRHIGTGRYKMWHRAAELSHKLHMRTSKYKDPNLEGGWHGNQTVWRMTLDLNRLLRYGNADGTLADTPQRTFYSLCDAVVAGDGEGPLAVSPVHLGAVTFSSSSAFSDYLHAALMHFDWRKVHTVREAFGTYRYPLADASPEDLVVKCDDRSYSVEEAGRVFGTPFRPAVGWRDAIEWVEEAE